MLSVALAETARWNNEKTSPSPRIRAHVLRARLQAGTEAILIPTLELNVRTDDMLGADRSLHGELDGVVHGYLRRIDAEARRPEAVPHVGNVPVTALQSEVVRRVVFRADRKRVGLEALERRGNRRIQINSFFVA